MKPDEIRTTLDEVLRRIERLGLTNREESLALLDGDDGRAHLSTEKTFSLVKFDADSIQEQVFASPRPVTIAGASALLRDWDDRLHERVGNDAVVLYSGGGQAVLLTRANHAKDLRDKLVREFEEHSGRSPCTTAHVCLSPYELVHGPHDARKNIDEATCQRVGWSPKGGGGFGACMSLLEANLRQEKGSPKNIAWLPEGSRVARCVECAERPRDKQDELCERCKTNRRHGQRVTKDWEHARAFEDVIFGPVKEDGRRESGAGRHLAFVRVDGAGIGGILEKLSTIKQYATVSYALKEAFEFKKGELEKLGVPAKRYQLPIAGGDDIMLVVPAKWHQPKSGLAGDAFALARDLVKRIEATFDADALRALFLSKPELLEKVRSIGAGVGIVISSGIPARFCFDYAYDLIRSSKEAIDERNRDKRSAIDFAVLYGGSPLVSSMQGVRRTMKETKEISLGESLEGIVHGTARPFTAKEFADFLACAHRLLKVPRSSLHGLRDMMDDPQTGLSTVKYQIARNRDLRAALTDINTPLSKLPAEVGHWVLHPTNSRLEGKRQWVTPLPDLLEVLPFVNPI